MEPEMSAHNPSPEMGPAIRGGESTPSFTGGERPQAPSVERAPRQETREMLPAPTAGGQPAFVAPPLPVLPPALPQQSAKASTAGPADDTPVAAADEDLIEKEWVDKAKKIIATTKNDPYLQEKEVSKLQADYLKKRYGKDIKLPIE